MLHSLVLFLFLLVSSSSNAGGHDFCVADLTAPRDPAGYSCLPTAEVTADDFVYSGLSVPGNYLNLFNSVSNTANVDQFPGLNGLGLSMARTDIAPGGVVPMHHHPRASAIILIAKGSVTAGFISSNNTLYMKKLKEGDIMVFPQGLLHFQVNTGKTQALVWSSYSSSEPGMQILSNALFSNNLPSEYIEKTTLIDDDEVRRLKAIFGGSSGFNSA